MSEYYYGHGEGWAATRTTNGDPGNFDILLPEINSLSFDISRESIEHISKRTAIASVSLKKTRLLRMNGTMTVSQHTKEILAMGLYGSVVAVAGGSFVAANAIFPTVAVGDVVQIPGGRLGISSLVIVDSTGSPITLTLGTHYEVVDLDAGLIRILNITSGSVVQPFKAAGTEEAGSNVAILTQRVTEKWLRFKGINIARDDERVEVVDIYRMQLEPMANWGLLNDGGEVNAYEIAFEAMADPTKAADATLGRHGKIKIPS